MVLATLLTRLIVAERVGAADENVWSGVYHHAEKPGFAVEFSGTNCSVRTHDGAATTDGIVRIVDGAREVRACCTSFRFRTGPGDTLVDQHTNTWHRTPPSWPLQKLPRAPLTVRVVDEKTEKPVAACQYRYWLSAPQGEEYPPWVMARTVTNASGTFTIEAPLSCELGMEIDALDYLCHGSGYGRHSFDITSTNTKRAVTVHLPRGLTVEGRVVDADTGSPVSNATVSPLIGHHHGTSPNRHRQVVTDEKGRFVVHAVSESWGISVDHRRYGETETEYRELENWPAVADDPYRRREEIQISEAHCIAGIVADSEGNPLANVWIESYNGRRARTDQEGRFEVYGATEGLMIETPGFIDGEIPVPPVSTNMTIVLERQYQVRGKVVTPEEKPVQRFTIVTRDGYRTRCREVRSETGEFELELERPVTNLVAISADGYALTHAPMMLVRPETRLTVTMQRGVSVSGTVQLPQKHRETATVSLVPQCEGRFWRAGADGAGWAGEDDILVFATERKAGCASELGTLSARLSPDGSYHVMHVAPGSYTLSVSGEGLETAERTVRIPEKGRRLPQVPVRGASPTPTGVGTVKGRVYRPYRPRSESAGPKPVPWTFADGRIGGRKTSLGDTLRFKADENGYYCVTNLPAGPVWVGASQNGRFGGFGSLSATGMVRDGATTVIDLRPEWAEPKPETPPDVAMVSVTFQIGDGGEADRLRGLGVSGATTDAEECEWSLRLTQTSPAAGKEPWERTMRLDDETIMVGFADVPPGRYDLALFGGSGWRGNRLLAEPKPVIVLPDTDASVDMSLPPHSLRGRAANKGAARWTDIYVVREDRDCPVREVPCSTDGCFVVPFLRTGKYLVYAYENDTGWFHRQDVAVDGVCDVGSIRLQPGAKLSGQLLSDWTPVRDAHDYTVRARHGGTGIELTETPDSGENGGRFVFGNLWPGQWRVTLETGERELVATNVVLKGTTPVFVELSWTE